MTGEHTFAAYLFDGRRSAAIDVDVTIDDGELVIREPATTQRWPLGRIAAGERFAHTPRVVGLPGGATLEVPDASGGFDTALQRAGIAPGLVPRMQQHRFAAAVALLFTVALGVYAYREGIPAVARFIANRFPPALEQQLGQRLLGDADGALFAPSQLPDARRAALDARFASAGRRAAPGVDYRVIWRRIGNRNLPNALTLPGGTIVMLDGLDAAVTNDDALVGIFGHELGHVAGRHTLRQLIQMAGVGGLAHIVWGDMASLLLNGAVIASSLTYSRDMEREADAFAADLLKASGLSAEPLIDFLARMEADDAARDFGRAPAFLTTHPSTGERVRNLRDAMATR